VHFILVLVCVVLTGTGVCSIAFPKFEQLIAEMLVGVGSSDEYSGGEETDHQD
jgi:hypothetical protein